MNDCDEPVDDLDPLFITALHEAGHAAFALSNGIDLDKISIEPDERSEGRIIYTPMPRPSERDCRPDSLWFQTNIKLKLAGDRAVRRRFPFTETVGGGPTSDWTKAMRLAETVCDGPAAEALLNQGCIDLDDFFDRSETVELVDTLCGMLLFATEVDGRQVREELFSGRCGALHPEQPLRCELSPHLGDHMVRRSAPWLSDGHIVWGGLGASDRTPKSKRSALHRRVLRVVEPDLYPARQTRPKVSELPGLTATANDPVATPSARAAASRTIGRLIDDHARIGSHHLPPHTGLDTSTVSALQLHDKQCPKKPELDPDGYWCDRCAFQMPVSGRRPRRWIYQVSRIRPMREPNGEALVRVPVPESIFATADRAATYLRLVREANPFVTYQVQRWPSPRTK